MTVQDEAYEEVLAAVRQAAARPIPGGTITVTATFPVEDGTLAGGYELLEVQMTTTRHARDASGHTREPSVAARALVRRPMGDNPRWVPLPAEALDALAGLTLLM